MLIAGVSSVSYEYVVEVKDFIRNIVIEHLSFEDANTAYQEKRACEDYYRGYDYITVTLIEPS